MYNSQTVVMLGFLDVQRYISNLSKTYRIWNLKYFKDLDFSRQYDMLASGSPSYFRGVDGH